jgi:hypothetical protein
MRHSISILILILISFSALGQTKEVSIHFNHKYNGANFNFDSTYVVDGTTPIKFDRLEYYLHINSLSNNDGDTTYLSDTYLLVNPSQNQYNIGPFEISDVNSLFFNIGVALEVNHNDPSLWNASHPLSPQDPSMHWGWAAGYRFVALEGMIDKNNDGIIETVVQYHPVDDSYYSEIITCDGVVETNSTITFFIEANYDKLIENIGTDQGGVYHGLHDENQLLINNFIYNNVFTVPENLNLKEISISNTAFPNPFSNTIQLNLNENSIVKVYNSLGILVDAYKLDKGQQQINTQTLLNGVYILSLQSKSGTENIKLLKN